MRHRPVTKLSRSLGIPLTPKVVKYLDRRPNPPGRGGRGPSRMSPYKERLVEKQRLRFQYNISEKQLRRAFEEAVRSNDPTGPALLEDLESRLDAVVLRSGFARTVYQARQLVSHGHVLVDGKRINRPAYRVKPGQKVSIAQKSKSMPLWQLLKDFPATETVPNYLDVDMNALAATLVARPSRALIPVICNEQLVVEYYAR